MSRRSKLAVVSLSTLLVVFLLLGTVMGKRASADTNDAYKHLMVFTEVLSRIKSEYVEEPEVKNVTSGALNGMLEAIDPYASYLNADQYKQYLKAKNGGKGEIGVALAKKFGYIGVIDVLPNSPAAKAGLNTNDMLESINGVATRDMPLAYAEMLLKGEPGTKVDLSVLRVTRPEPQRLSLIRAVVPYPNVTSKLLADGVGHVTVPYVDAARIKQVTQALTDLQKQGAKRLVLDLRSSAMGTPEDGVALANLFLDKGTITYLQGQKSPRQNFDAVAGKSIWKQPVVVITNRGTASAAEIAAAALLDNKRAEIVGEKTYGDAGLRKAIGLDDGSAIILSVAKYYSPSGKAIQDTGVTPTVLQAEFEPPVEVEDETGAPRPEAETAPRPTEDVLLKKALEVLNRNNAAQAASATAR